jgi:uncharacterized integral membrane protein (TIGR00698 family)
MDTPSAKNHKLSFHLSERNRQIIFLGALAICVFPVMSPPLSLLLGLIVAQLMDNPYAQLTHKATHWLLQASVVGLGFGMNIAGAWQAGKEGTLFTVVSITTVFTVGILAGRFLKIDKITSFLISAGTAICGGSAIAALSPVIKAQEKQISVSLGVIFILNSIALFLFPAIGHHLHLSQTQFGLWCAIAIHDTSSVVGAASHYGAQALQVATTVKLARALWIIPIAFISTIAFKTGDKKIKIPYFIGVFILAMLINSYVPIIKPIVPYLTSIAKTGLTLTLFLIGSGLSFKKLRSVGIVPFFQGVMLWALISGLSLFAILNLG